MASKPSAIVWSLSFLSVNCSHDILHSSCPSTFAFLAQAVLVVSTKMNLLVKIISLLPTWKSARSLHFLLQYWYSYGVDTLSEDLVHIFLCNAGSAVASCDVATCNLRLLIVDPGFEKQNGWRLAAGRKNRWFSWRVSLLATSASTVAVVQVFDVWCSRIFRRVRVMASNNQHCKIRINMVNWKVKKRFQY